MSVQSEHTLCARERACVFPVCVCVCVCGSAPALASCVSPVVLYICVGVSGTFACGGVLKANRVVYIMTERSLRASERVLYESNERYDLHYQ